MNRPRILDHRRLEFSGFVQGGGLVAPPGFISKIGTLLPMAPKPTCVATSALRLRLFTRWC
ncbi:hypothetical protein BS629_26190 [Rhizobium leguminosarum bv. viciae USDA 2370]|nr:hypothetical protein BS629_26190 [Rhizobium leguminosarum bv. viciae USDA 2370]